MHHYYTHILPGTMLRTVALFLLLLLTPGLFAQQAVTYDEAIVLADKNYQQKNYLDAKAYYQMALKYKSGDAYASQQIATIVEKLKAGMVEEEAYFDIVDLADVFYEEGALDKALVQYKKALTIIPDDEYAHKKIADIQRTQTEEKDRLSAYNKSMQQGDALMAGHEYQEAIKAFKNALLLYPEKTLAAEKIRTAQQLQTEKETKMVSFNEETEMAGRYLLVKDYATALEHYESALALFPYDEDLAKKIEAIRPQAENQRQYNQQVEAADELYISKDFLSAKAKYNEASKLWPENTYPADMVKKIDEQLALQRKDLDKNYKHSITKADSLLALQIYADAKAEYNLALILKPNENYPKTKLKEINAYFAEQQKAFENNYAQMLQEADKLFEEKEFARAKEKYEQALETKPNDNYPKDQLAAIESLFAARAAEKKKDEAYSLLVAEADKLFANGHYDLAINKYQEAQMLKTAENYPDGKIKEIQQLMVDAEKQKEIDKAFGLQMVLGVRLFQEGKYNDAKNAYNNALEIKPYDEQPKLQIARIDSIVEAQIMQEQADKASAELIAKGDSLQDSKEYDLAILAYEQALQVKPKDPVAAQKLSKVKIVKRNYEKAIARQKSYDESIALADGFFDEENYELAKTEYEKALEFKSNETYPKQRLTAIESLLEKMAAERQQRFEDAIVKADNHFEQFNYQEAVLEYKIAESIKPSESYPKQRIAECNTFLAERLREIKAQYNIAIADADKLYATKIYDKAIKAYKKAIDIKPDEAYPREQIDKITKLIEVNAITDVVNEIIVIHSETTERFAFEPLPINVRKSNYILVKARNLGEKSFKIIFTYGSKNGKNGGFVVQVPEGNEYNDFIIRVGNQYKWFSEDNNWLSAYPENGDIEIKMIQISKSD